MGVLARRKKHVAGSSLRYKSICYGKYTRNEKVCHTGMIIGEISHSVSGELVFKNQVKEQRTKNGAISFMNSEYKVIMNVTSAYNQINTIL